MSQFTSASGRSDWKSSDSGLVWETAAGAFKCQLLSQEPNKMRKRQQAGACALAPPPLHPPPPTYTPPSLLCPCGGAIGFHDVGMHTSAGLHTSRYRWT